VLGRGEVYLQLRVATTSEALFTYDIMTGVSHSYGH